MQYFLKQTFVSYCEWVLILFSPSLNQCWSFHPLVYTPWLLNGNVWAEGKEGEEGRVKGAEEVTLYRNVNRLV